MKKKREKQNTKVNSKKGYEQETKEENIKKKEKGSFKKNNAQEFEQKWKQVTIVITLSMLILSIPSFDFEELPLYF